MVTAAGIIVYKISEELFAPEIKFLLVHPGGPFWVNKQDGVWSIPKGEANEGEELIEVARREFAEETSLPIPQKLEYVGQIKYKSGKIVHAFAGRNDDLPDIPEIKSNTIDLEWPPRTGKIQQIPEVDKAQFFTLEEAKVKILPAQFELLEKILQTIIQN